MNLEVSVKVVFQDGTKAVWAVVVTQLTDIRGPGLESSHR